MVFCGKPSGGCHACRARKTKCDQIPEGCTQCKRAKRACPGYRSKGALIFRDESANVIRKLKAREFRTRQASFSTSVPEFSSEDDREPEISLEIARSEDLALSTYSLAPPIEDRAIGLFLSEYVDSQPLRGPRRGQFDFLDDLSRKEVLSDGLICSMKAVGMAGYAHLVHAPSLMKNARYQYLLALQSTNAALRDPIEVKRDATLLATIILGLFETITGVARRSLDDWAEHTRGASALIKLRGPNQIKSNIGRRMLVNVNAQLLLICLSDGVGLPDHMVEYNEAAIKLVETPDPSFVVQNIMMRLCQFRAEILKGSLSDPQEILAKALDLDGILLKIATDVPPGWEYDTVFTDDDLDIVYNGRYHIYHDYWIAQMWNSLRAVRIMLNEVIRGTLLKGFASKPPIFTGTEYTAQFQISTDILYELQADILHSVPQHLGKFPKPNVCSDTSTFVSRNVGGGGFTNGRMSGGTFLIWPLWFAGVMDIATEEVKEFVIMTLKSVGDCMGIRLANVLANSVKANSDIKLQDI